MSSWFKSPQMGHQMCSVSCGALTRQIESTYRAGHQMVETTSESWLVLVAPCSMWAWANAKIKGDKWVQNARRVLPRRRERCLQYVRNPIASHESQETNQQQHQNRLQVKWLMMFIYEFNVLLTWNVPPHHGSADPNSRSHASRIMCPLRWLIPMRNETWSPNSPDLNPNPVGMCPHIECVRITEEPTRSITLVLLAGTSQVLCPGPERLELF